MYKACAAALDDETELAECAACPQGQLYTDLTLAVEHCRMDEALEVTNRLRATNADDAATWGTEPALALLCTRTRRRTVWDACALCGLRGGQGVRLSQR